MKNPWIPFYWGDYVAHTQDLSTFEHGCYILLLARYYITGKALPTNDDVLFRICRANELQERNSVMRVVAQFFVEKGGEYHHNRADDELKKRASISKVRSYARSQRGNKCSTNVEHVKTQPQPQSHKEKNTHSEPKTSQEVFDRMEMRKVADAYRKLEQRLKASVGAATFTEQQVIEWVCEEVGISVVRFLELKKKQFKWPAISVATA